MNLEEGESCQVKRNSKEPVPKDRLQRRRRTDSKKQLIVMAEAKGALSPQFKVSPKGVAGTVSPPTDLDWSSYKDNANCADNVIF